MKKANIVVTDGYTLNPGDNPWDAVATLGNLIVYERLMDNEIVERCREAEILVVNKTQIQEAAMAEMPRLKFIAVSATGFDCVDIEFGGAVCFFGHFAPLAQHRRSRCCRKGRGLGPAAGLVFLANTAGGAA